MQNNSQLLILAPMEGVMDYSMRQIITNINSFDLCITEFIRVVESLVPKHVFYKNAPELRNAGKTHNNTPIRIQLLGQHPQWMAENANRAIELGSQGVDINFGCPAKAVNKSKGGAVLLKTPETIHQIVHAVRSALPESEQVSAKIRLGFDDASLLDEIVDAIETAKADFITVHARTKSQGYKPPAYWHHIGALTNKYKIPIVANGEIWNRKDALNCIQESQTSNLMLGRGVLSLPNLANVIRQKELPYSWQQCTELLQLYCKRELNGDKQFYLASRIKQWLRHLKKEYSEAEILFSQLKYLTQKEAVAERIFSGIK